MAFTQSPSLSNNPKIPTYYLIFAVAVSYMMMNMIQMHCSYDSQYAIIAMMIRLANFLNLMGESVVQTN